MSVLLEFSMYPIGESESLSRYVAGSLDIIDSSGLPYRMNPMGTVIEGRWDEVFDVVKQCYERMSSQCPRVSCSIKVDAREDRENRLTEKVESVEKTLGRSLKQ